jgi:ribose transport system substrate-binding protein
MKLRAVLYVAILALLAGCGGGEKKTTEGETPKGEGAGKKIVVGMSQCNLGEPWRQRMNAEMAEAAKKYPNLEIVYKDAANSSTTQQNQMHEFMQMGVDAIIISPKETEPLTKPVAEAFKKGIPVIVLDRAVNGDQFTMFIGGDNVKIGKAAGEEMVKLLGGKGKIVELKGLLSSVPAHDRHDGFMQGIKGSQIEIIFDPACDWLENRAQTEMNSALSRFDHIDAVYGHNDPAAHGAYMAAKQKNREKEMKFIGIDANPNEGIQYVKDGILDATFEYPTGAKEGVDWVMKILEKKEMPPKKLVLGTRIYTKENVASGGKEL